MSRLTIAAAAGLAAIFSIGSAQAADISYEPPMIEPLPIEAGGWYLRGFIGMSNQQVDNIYNVLFETTDVTFLSDPSFESGIIGGGGFGYRFNDWFRADFTGEYRGKTGFTAYDVYPGGSNDYTAKKSEWLLLANAYFDLGTWKGITPYVGAGVGAARVTIHDFVDVNVITAGGGTAADASKWNFAWALHAGVGYEVNDRLTIDLAYRYVDLGDGVTGDIVRFDGVNNVYNPMHFNDITSHDIMLGFRYALGGKDYYSDAPVFARN